MENANIAYIQGKLATVARQDRSAEVNFIQALQRAVRCAYNDSITEANFILSNVPDRLARSAVLFYNKFGLDVARVAGNSRVLGVKDKSAQAKQLDAVRKVDSLGWTKQTSADERAAKLAKQEAKQAERIEKTTAQERALDAMRKLIEQAQKNNDLALVDTLSNAVAFIKG